MSTGTSNVAKVGPDCDLESNSHATQVEELAQFVCRSRWDQISEPAREQLKLRVLDSLGVALGALDGDPVAMVRELEGKLRAVGHRPEFHYYPGAKHWFAEPSRPQYDASAAALAWERTVGFLRRTLTG